VTGLLALAVTAILAQNGSSDRMKAGSETIPMSDQHFMMKAGQAGMAPVQLRNLAKERASSQAVKDFGQTMVDDHTKANDQLKSLAQQKKVALPTSLDAKDQTTMDRLTKLNGQESDRAYMRDMVLTTRRISPDFRRKQVAVEIRT